MSAKPRIMVVDDEPNMRTILSGLLIREGYDVQTAENGRAAVEALSKSGGEVHVVVTDLRMPEMDGMTLLSHIHKNYPGRPVVMITAHGSVDTAVEAMKHGAFDFVTKPFDASELRAVIRKAVNTAMAEFDHVEPIRTQEEGTEGRFGMIGSSRPMQELYHLLDKVADSPTTVLITGESGTGKELVAQALHDFSARASRPFIKVNCAAIPEALQESELFGHERGAFTGATDRRKGRFEQADGGTLFLDEIGETPSEVQPILLRALETGEVQPVGGRRARHVDVRVISATDADLKQFTEEKRFRLPLLHRLAGFELQVPSLKVRREDIAYLAVHFLREQLGARGESWRIEAYDPDEPPWLPIQLMVRFLQHAWPGNVRELKNAVQQMIIASRGRNEACLPDSLDIGREEPEEAPEPHHDTPPTVATKGPTDLSEITDVALIEALEANRWKVAATSRALGIAKNSLYRLMERCDGIRLAKDLTEEEVKAAYEAHGGDTSAMSSALKVSQRSLKLRLTQLGVE